jgi:hypothetical protein
MTEKQEKTETLYKKVLLDFDALNFNNYYKDMGIEYIKASNKIYLDDPIIDLILQKEADKILTPLEDWNLRKFKNNNIN